MTEKVNILFLDFETRSPVDLGARGATVYSEHPNTEVMCASLAINEEQPTIWINDKLEVNPSLLEFPRISYQDAVEKVNLAHMVVAHNALFEYRMWPRFRECGKAMPPLKLIKLYDTMAQLAYHALPQKLGEGGRLLNLPQQKDQGGHALMLKMCKPRNGLKAEKEQLKSLGYVELDYHIWQAQDGGFYYLWHDPADDVSRLANYCCRDVSSMRDLYHALPQLPDFERKAWLHTQVVNLRGVPVDIESAEKIVSAITAREEELRQLFIKAVNNEVSGPKSYVKFRQWVCAKLNDDSITSLDKEATKELLKRDNLPNDVREALIVKSEIGKASVSKFTAIIDKANADGFVTDWARYGGASTMRWAAMGFQLQNMPRDSFAPDEYATAVDLIYNYPDAVNIFYESLFHAASRCVRGAIKAPDGWVIVCADYSSVEGRGLAWLARDFAALKVYQDGLDPYKIAAVMIFGVAYEDIDKAMRLIGKVCELALGYEGGIGAYASMSHNYGLDLETLPPFILHTATADELEGDYGAIALADKFLKINPGVMSREAAISCDVIKRRWRKDRPETVAFWKELKTAATNAILYPGQVFEVGVLKFHMRGDFLRIFLPSGRAINYFKPRIEMADSPWGEKVKAISYWSMKQIKGTTIKKFVKVHTHGGKIAENVTQAVCRDLICVGMWNVEREGFPVFLHAHDEAGALIRDPGKRYHAEILKRYESLLATTEPWAAGFPLKAEGWVDYRFKK